MYPKKITGGRVKRNPVPPSKYAKVKEAIERFKEFTGHDPEFVDELKVPGCDVAFKIGTCDGLLYTTVRDNRKESYIHKFKKNARPTLAISYDGQQIIILGGEYDFTERGIVDR